ncbi:MAG: AmmeMemoRadiSam system protein B [Anaerolineaceae bacterium]
MSALSDLRPSPIAGRWYPGNPTELAEEVDAFLEEAEIEPLSGQVIGLVVPHAGHRYSGRTAGHGFRAVMGMHFDIVAVVAPFHDYHPAEILVSGHQAYATPLGALTIDREAVAFFSKKLIELGGPTPQEVVYDQEHSLEIELPFLQAALTGEFQLLPLMLRDRSEGFCRLVGKALAAVLKNRSALLVASSDLSHFHPEEKAVQLDSEMLQLICSYSPEEILKADAGGRAFACGANTIASVLWAARELGADQVKILHHSTSAAETGDHSSVVGYGAAAILKTL